MRFRRRHLFACTVALVVTACGRRPEERPPATPAPLSPEFDRWSQEATGILSDSIQALRVFDTFQAFRVSTAAQSGMRLASELMWDAPTSAAWDEATHVARGLHGRADQLFQAVTTASLDETLWRQQRDAADAVNDLLNLGGALGAYRDRIDLVPPGDASSALNLLDTAWAQWDAAAARWGISRAEPLGCAPT